MRSIPAALIVSGIVLWSTSICLGAGRVKEIKPNVGSITGGSLIEINGEGFSNDQFSLNANDPSKGNKVIFVNTRTNDILLCDIITSDSNSGRILCETRPSPAGDADYYLRVEVDGKRLNNDASGTYCGGQCYFRYRSSYTPTIESITPSAGMPGEILKISGNIHTTQISRLSKDFDATSPEINKIFVGNDLCEPFDSETKELIGAGMNECSNNRNCHGYFKCQPVIKGIGCLNVSYIVSSTGRSVSKQGAFFIDDKDNRCVYQTYADVESVSPKIGSINGGTLLTIKGNFFNEKIESFAVEVSGVPCEVKTATKTEITCLTGKAPAKVANESAPYPGSRGARIELWNKTAIYSISKILSLNSSNAGYKTWIMRDKIDHSKTTTPYSVRSSGKIEGFFVPPYDACYRFYIAADDVAELHLSKSPGPASALMEKIARCPRYSTYNFFKFPEQQSKPICLKKDLPYYVSLPFYDYGGGYFARMGVKIDQTKWTTGQVDGAYNEKQKIVISTTYLLEKQSINASRFSSTFKLRFGGRTSSDLTRDSTAEKMKNALNDMFSSRCSYSPNKGTGFMFLDYEGLPEGTEYGKRITSVQPMCGRKSLSVLPYTYIFDAGKTGANGRIFQAYDPYRYTKFCFSHYGVFFQYVRFQIQYTNKDGKNAYHYAWYRYDRQAQFSFWKWYHVCIDVKAHMDNDKNLKNRAHINSQYSIVRIITTREGRRLGLMLIDDVWIGTTNMAVAVSVPAAMPGNGFIEEFDVNKNGTNFQISMKPGNCFDDKLPLFAIDGLGVELDSMGKRIFNKSGTNEKMEVTRQQSSSPKVSGTYKILLNGKSLDVSANISDANLKGLMESTFGTCTLTVARTGDCYGYTWTIEWVECGGNKPELQVDGTALKGTNVSIKVTTLRNGGIIMNPIPAQFFRTAEPVPQVTVKVNGVVSSCKSGNCSYIYDDAFTPKVKGVSPTEGQSGTNGACNSVLINGTGFGIEPMKVTVKIGSAPCNVTNITQSAISCCLGQSIAGEFPVNVHVQGKGLSTSHGIKFRYLLQLTSSSPKNGSTNGGTLLRIDGNGFGTKKSNVRVLINNGTCEVVSVTMFSVKCYTPKQAAGYANIMVLAGNVNSSLLNAFLYDHSLTPLISASNFRRRPAFVGGSENLVLTGRLLSSSEGVPLVTIGGKPCNVTSHSDQNITCLTPSHPPGRYKIEVIVPGKGAAAMLNASNSDMYYCLEALNVTNNIGSLMGNTEMRIQGYGFSSNISDNKVMIGNNQCKITGSSKDSITCVSPSSSKIHLVENTGVRAGYPPGYAWKPEVLEICLGDTVQWKWFSDPLSKLTYGVYQTDKELSQTPMADGFRAQSPSSKGTFSYKFEKVGHFFYTSGKIRSGDSLSLEGKIFVKRCSYHCTSIKVIVKGHEAIYHQGCLSPDKSGKMPKVTSSQIIPQKSFSAVMMSTTHPLPMPEYSAPTNCDGQGETGPLTDCPDSASHCTKNGLNFRYSKCFTPVVTRISNREFDASTEVQLTGQGFSNLSCLNNVYLGDHLASIISSSESNITFKINTRYSEPPIFTGLKLKLSVRNRGVALLDLPYTDKIVVIHPTIYDFYPRAGSQMGGSLVHINGYGFQKDFKVYVGTRICTIQEISYRHVICVTSQLSQQITANQSHELKVTRGDLKAVCKAQPNCYFTYSASLTPRITFFSPNFVNSSGQVLNIHGQGFNASSVNITVGPTICDITASNISSIKCILSGIPAGPNPLEVLVIPYGKAHFSVPGIIQGQKSLTSVTPDRGSIFGGTKIVIAGNGFKAGPTANNILTRVTVNGQPCPLTGGYITFSRISCITPPGEGNAVVKVISNNQQYPTLSFTYSNQSTPRISSMSSSTGHGGMNVVLEGTNLNSSASSLSVVFGGLTGNITSVNDTHIGVKLPFHRSGLVPVKLHIAGRGYANEVNFTYILDVHSIQPKSSGYGGGIELTIKGNSFDQVSKSNITICGKPCLAKSVRLMSDHEMLTCIIPSYGDGSPGNSGNQSCPVAVEGASGQRKELANAFTYVADMTAEVFSVTPRRGGTGGGVRVTITGKKFRSNGNTSVTIDGVQCDVQSADETTIVCLTGPSTRTVKTKVRVLVGENGVALTNENSTFYYVDVWSSRFSWGGKDLPKKGEFIIIPKGKVMLLDVDTPVLKFLLVKGGTFMFDEKDLHLQAEYIMITDGGQFLIGSPDKPFKHKATITIHGHVRSTELPIYGAKSIAVREGLLGLYGKPKLHTWTYLKETAWNKTSTIKLTQQVADWNVGDKIVLAATGKSIRENEVVTITAVRDGGSTLDISPPLQYNHIAITQNLCGKQVDFRGEVGLLTRNILIKGSSEKSWETKIESCPAEFEPGQFKSQTCFDGRFGEERGSDQFGVQIIVHSGEKNSRKARGEFSYVEIYNAGQAFRLGRYPIHFHMDGDVYGSYVKGCAIHRSFNRAITIHGVRNLVVERNVVYDILGNAVFMENGIEINNTVQYNLGIFVKPSSSTLNVDVTPATFWVTNADNHVNHNAAAGGSHFGYWYQMFEHPDGPSFTKSVCPRNVPMREFINNTAHTFGRYGLWIFPIYHPKEGGACSAKVAKSAEFRSMVSWNNMRGAETGIGGAVQFVDFVGADNDLAAVEVIVANSDDAPWGGAMVKDSCIVGHSKLRDYNKHLISTHRRCTEAGIKLPKSPRLTVSNVTFVNFDMKGCSPLSPCAHCKIFQGGFNTKFEKIKFVNTNSIVPFQWKHEAVLEDLDGTLTGYAGGSIVPSMDTLPPHLCVQHENVSIGAVNGSICKGEISFKRMAANDVSPSSLDGNGAILSNKYGNTSCPWKKKGITHPKGWTCLVAEKDNVHITFDRMPPFTNISYKAGFSEMKPKDYLYISHHFKQVPDYFSTTSRLVNDSNAIPDSVSSNHGDWHFDSGSRIMTYIVKSIDEKNDSTTNINYKVYRCYYNKCIPPTPPPPITGASSNGSRKWSDKSSWKDIPAGYGGADGNLPKAGDKVMIPSEWYMILDIVPPKLDRLYIYGTLELDPEINHSLNASLIYIGYSNGVQGRLIIGSPSKPMLKNVFINLVGDHSTKDLVMTSRINAGAKALAVDGGKLIAYGKPHRVHWVRLGQTAAAGASSLLLEEDVDWSVGDEIVISTTSFVPEEAEKHTIAAISADNKTLTLSGKLKFKHIAGQHQMGSHKVTLSAKVGLLTRNIVIQGVNDPSDSLGKQSFGGRVLLASYRKGIEKVSAEAKLSEVQFKHFGQYGWNEDYDPRFGLAFIDLNDASTSFVHGCSFDDGYNTGLGIFSTSKLNVTDNVFYRVVDSGIRIKSSGNRILRNLIVYAMALGYFDGRKPEFDPHWQGAVDIQYAGEVILVGNVVSGVEKIGYRVAGEKCTSDSSSWRNNEVHAATHGIHLPYTDTQPGCAKIAGFTVWKAYDFGIFTYSASSVHIVNCTVGESGNGLAVYAYGPPALSHKTSDRHIKVSDSVIFGISPNYDCVSDAKQSYITKNLASAHGPKGPNGGLIGAMISFFSSTRAGGPKMAWDSPKSYPTISGKTSYERVTFAHFKTDSCGKSHKMMATNTRMGDIFHPVDMKQIQLHDVHKANKLYIHTPTLTWINPSDCVDMDCDALRKVSITDLDGTLFGTVMSTAISKSEYQYGGKPSFGLGNYRIPKVLLSREDGTKIDADIKYPKKGIVRGVGDRSFCNYDADWNAYLCTGMKYRMLVVESLDEDRETRRLSPVALAANGYIDLINGPMDHGWCFGYTCQERISTFYPLVATETQYELAFTSYNPQDTRLHLLNAANTDAIVIGIYYYKPQRLDVFVNGRYMNPKNSVRNGDKYDLMPKDPADPNKYIPKLDDVHGTGTNYFDRSKKMLYILVKGAAPIDIKTSQVIQLTLGVDSSAVTTEDFFKKNLVANLAALLGIPSNKIRVMDVVKATSRRKRRSTTSQIQVEIGDPPSNTSQPSVNTTEAPSNSSQGATSFQELQKISEKVVESGQTGEMSKALNLDLATMSVVEPEPKPVDPTGGVRATNATAQVVNATNSTLTYAQKLALQQQTDSEPTLFLIPKKIKLTNQPSGSNETVPLPSYPQIRVYDALDRVVNNLGIGNSIWKIAASLVPGTGDPNARLEGNTTISFVNGTANFANIAVTHSGTGYRLQFNVTYPTTVDFNVVSDPFDIKERVLYFSLLKQPSDANESLPFGVQPSVEVRDAANGELVNNTGWKGRKWLFNATLIQGGNAGSSLVGNSSVEFENGVAVFKTLGIDSPGKSYKLHLFVKTVPSSRYSAYYLTNEFDVRERQLYLHIAQQPGDCNETVPCGNQPILEVRSVYPDALAGNLGWKGRKWSIRVAMYSGSNDKLNGTLEFQIPTSGRAIFKDLLFTEAATGYTLRFEVLVDPHSPRFSNMSAISDSFDIKERQFYLALIRNPGNANDSVAFGQQPLIEVRDVGTGKAAYPLKKQWSVSVNISTNPSSGVLSGTKNISVVGVQAVFTDLSIAGYGVGYRLSFVSNFGHQVTSVPFNVRYKNDYYPTFQPGTPASLSIYENTTVNTLLYTYVATDADSGIAGTVKYKLLPASLDWLFQLQSTSGQLSLKHTVDRENVSSYRITIRAMDSAPSPFELVKDHYVTITILDINDHTPTFSSPHINITIPETAAVGKYTFNVSAIDRDEGINSKLTYQVSWVNNPGFFQLNTSNGIFKVTSSLDLDHTQAMEPSYSFRITATDGGSPALASTSNVTLKVVRVNEFSPTFTTPGTSLSIPENVPVGYLLYKVNATDEDSGKDGEVYYKLTSGNQDGKFSVDNYGRVTVTKSLDRETQAGFTLDVTASDNSSMPKTSAINIIIVLTDINDNRPTFTKPSYVLKVRDNIEIGAEAAMVGANDPDQGPNGTVVYSVLNPTNNFLTFFSVRNTSGKIVVKKSLDLDKEKLTRKEFHFTLVATDQGYPYSLNSSVNVTVIIAAVNDFPPVLSHSSSLVLQLDYNLAAGSTVTKINATDQDYGLEGLLTYSFAAGNENGVFNINNKTGQVTITKTPKRSFYVLDVLVSDNGELATRKTLQVELTVFISNSPNGSEAGKVYVGSKRGTVAVSTSSGQKVKVPVYINCGLQELEGADISVTYDVTFLRYESASTSFLVKKSGNSLNLIGLVMPNATTGGVYKVAELNFFGLLYGKAAVTGTAAIIVDKKRQNIPVKSAPIDVPCSSQVLGDINKDCKFNIRDAALVQTYVRESAGKFSSTFGKQLKSELTQQQISGMDVNKNHIIAYEDAAFLVSVIVGHAKFITNFEIVIPNHHVTSSCILKISAKLANPDGTAATKTQVYVVVSHSSTDLGASLQQSGFTRKTAFTLASGAEKYGTVLTLPSIGGGVYSLTTSNSTLQASGVGFTLLQVVEYEAGKKIVTSSYRHNDSLTSTTTAVQLESGVSFTAGSVLVPQSIRSVNETTSICRDPDVFKALKMVFPGNFDTIVAPNKNAFMNNFKAYMTTKYGVIIQNLRVIRGSIIVFFDLGAKKSVLTTTIDQLTTDISNERVILTYNGHRLIPSKTLTVDGKESVPNPVRTSPKETKTAVIVVSVVVVLLLLGIGVVFIYLVWRRKNSKSKVVSDNTEAIQETKMEMESYRGHANDFRQAPYVLSNPVYNNSTGSLNNVEKGPYAWPSKEAEANGVHHSIFNDQQPSKAESNNNVQTNGMTRSQSPHQVAWMDSPMAKDSREQTVKENQNVKTGELKVSIRGRDSFGHGAPKKGVAALDAIVSTVPNCVMNESNQAKESDHVRPEVGQLPGSPLPSKITEDYEIPQDSRPNSRQKTSDSHL